MRDHTLLSETLDEFAALAHELEHIPENPKLGLDAGYDYQPVHTDLAEGGITGRITRRGVKTPIQSDGRWVCERTDSWMNDFGKLRRNSEHHRICTEFYLALATAIITVRSLSRRAWYTHRWDTRPRTPRIRYPRLTAYGDKPSEGALPRDEAPEYSCARGRRPVLGFDHGSLQQFSLTEVRRQTRCAVGPVARRRLRLRVVASLVRPCAHERLCPEPPSREMSSTHASSAFFPHRACRLVPRALHHSDHP